MAKIKADTAVTHLDVFTVQTVFDLKGKYKAKNFSRHMTTSSDEE